MKKGVFIILFLTFIWTSSASGGGILSGKVTNVDGTPCSKCKISICEESLAYTDSKGGYSMKIKGKHVESIWVNDQEVWTGSKKINSRLELNLTAKTNKESKKEEGR